MARHINESESTCIRMAAEEEFEKLELEEDEGTFFSRFACVKCANVFHLLFKNHFFFINNNQCLVSREHT